jgi:hypothetical protein
MPRTIWRCTSLATLSAPPTPLGPSPPSSLRRGRRPPAAAAAAPPSPPGAAPGPAPVAAAAAPAVDADGTGAVSTPVVSAMETLTASAEMQKDSRKYQMLLWPFIIRSSASCLASSHASASDASSATPRPRGARRSDADTKPWCRVWGQGGAGDAREAGAAACLLENRPTARP